MTSWPCGQQSRPKAREVLPTERPTRRGNGTSGVQDRPWGQLQLPVGNLRPTRTADIVASWPGVRETLMDAACGELAARGHPVFRVAIPGRSRDGWAIRSTTDGAPWHA
jgi:hypothetical protein